ncbi:MAG: FAD-dependent oxidoreductase [Clostridioides sp.]|jgi:NADPH-dependent glutamate synthase beta subunit-like oxidoreductase|nr:FAD-dependent oxidoreductase [Clostridioides sp.]
MSRLSIVTTDRAQATVEGLYKDLERRIIASPPGLCPVDMAKSFLNLCHAQTCGKCVPCRIGLGQLQNLLEDVLNGDATMDTIDLIEKTARSIYYSADCAIGYEAAHMVLKGLEGFRNDYEEHILKGRCAESLNQAVPCRALCPAGVDIPGYIALVSEGRYADAVSLIRKDNPLVAVCGLICEHPCEARCRRNMIDDPINIRGLKRFAVDNAGLVKAPTPAEATNKKVAVIGGGAGGISAAYFLSLMGHKVTIFEQRKRLGGMLVYGIPNYRLPKDLLDTEIDVLLSNGVEVKKDVSVGKDISLDEIRNNFDAVYISIGAHTDKKIGLEGENGGRVISAVQMLREIGDGNTPDFKDKKVVVIGGGNVAMDVARSAVRCGAKETNIVYRRRIADMTALSEEIEGAIAEGCEVKELMAPVRIELDSDGNACALYVQPQIISDVKGGRPSPKKANVDEVRIPCDYVLVAIGQDIEIKDFEGAGIPVKRGAIQTLSSSGFEDIPGVFAGGDCVTGPATVIKAIAAGKVAAANIDEYLGFNHEISVDIDIPSPDSSDKVPRGRVNMKEREASKRVCDFELAEIGMTCEEAMQESRRCLRCDHFGFGNFKGGRVEKW